MITNIINLMIVKHKINMCTTDTIKLVPPFLSLVINDAKQKNCEDLMSKISNYMQKGHK